MNKKGQALVEFVLVFPIFLIIICTIIELGSINYQRIKLEDELDIVITMKEKEESPNGYLKKNNLSMKINDLENYEEIELIKKIDIFTPVLRAIYGKNFEITAERVFYDE